MKYISIIILFVFLFCSISCFAQDGQIDIDELIRKREAEQQSIEKLTSTLNQLTGNDKGELSNKFNSFIRNEDDEIVKFDDTSDEINLQFFVNLFNDNFIRNSVNDCLKKASIYINNKTEKDIFITLPYSEIIFVFCICVATLICSVSTITGKEASTFPMVIKDAEPDWKSIDKKINNLMDKKIIPLQVKKYKPIQDNNNSDEHFNPLEASYDYDYDAWLKIGKQAMSNLESFSNDQEFKNVYNHYHTNFVLSGYILEDAISEANSAEATLTDIDDKNNSLLTLMIKGKMANRFAGTEINGVNYISNQTDLAYISVFSENADNTQNEDNLNDFWSANAWV